MHRITSLVAVLGFLSIAAVPGTASGQRTRSAVPTGSDPEFEGRVELDRRVYSTQDRVRITAVAPAHDTNPAVVESVVVTIATRRSIVYDYTLLETGPDTGVFTGEIALDRLAPREDDSISVAFQVSATETALASGLIRPSTERLALEAY
jgi:hypothetical protein